MQQVGGAGAVGGGTPAAFATSATAAMSSTSSRGLPIVSPNSSRVRGVTASRQAPWSAGSTKVVSMPNRARVMASWLWLPP